MKIRIVKDKTNFYGVVIEIKTPDGDISYVTFGVLGYFWSKEEAATSITKNLEKKNDGASADSSKN